MYSTCVFGVHITVWDFFIKSPEDWKACQFKISGKLNSLLSLLSRARNSPHSSRHPALPPPTKQQQQQQTCLAKMTTIKPETQSAHKIKYKTNKQTHTEIRNKKHFYGSVPFSESKNGYGCRFSFGNPNPYFWSGESFLKKDSLDLKSEESKSRLTD